MVFDGLRPQAVPLLDTTNQALASPKPAAESFGHQSNLTPHFRREELLGTGATAEVWACRNNATGELVASKTFHMGSMRMVEKVAVKREVSVMQLLGEMGGHPNIVYLKEVVGSLSAAGKGDVHVLMEACGGGSLMDLILSHNKMPEPSVRHLVCQLASALSFCHSHGILHRDIKPDNILLDSPAESLYFSPGSSQVQAKLGDFGLACVLSDGGAAVGLAGTKYYTAPEILEGRRYGTSADVWSLGVVVCAALTAKLPFKGETDEDDAGLKRAVVASQVDFGLPAWEGVSAEAKDLIAWMLHPDPKERPTADDILAHPWCSRRVDGADATKCRCSAPSQLRSRAEDDAEFRPCYTGECFSGAAGCGQEPILGHAATVPVEVEAFHGCQEHSPELHSMNSRVKHLELCDSNCAACGFGGEMARLSQNHSPRGEHFAIDAC